MQPSRSEGLDGARSSPAAPFSVPAPGPSGDLTVLQRLEAFRDLIRHGHALLGEVVTYCRQAEAAVNEIAADKKDLDRMRMDLEQARVRADAEADAARTALAQLDVQRRELEAMRTELLRARTEMEQFQANQSQNAEALESSLREARKQQTQLEEELQRVRSHSVSPRTLDARLAQLGHMEAKLHATERELADTRQALEEERGRRDRAIALIKPKPVEAAQRAGTSPKP